MNYLLFKSTANHYYLYSSYLSQFFNIDKIVYNLLELHKQNCNVLDLSLTEFINHKNEKITEEDFQKARKKVSFYINNNVLNDNNLDISLKISPDTIKYQLANNPHIVFETTEQCNLKCLYCGYGDFYNSFDERKNSNMSVEDAKLIINYILEFSVSKYRVNFRNEIDISFYGGEPLLRINFIKEIIMYCKSFENNTLRFNFYMTTNAILLNKYMDYIVENKIGLLLSLDGNKMNHSYRVFPNGNNSFDLVYKNIKTLQETYPFFFKSSKVRFNSVLHNRNSVKEINNFIQTEFGKTPLISELNTVFVSLDKKQELFELYMNLTDSISQSEDYYRNINENDPIQVPDFMEGIHFIFKLLNQVFENYIDLKHNIRYKMAKKPTGTCLPFARKIFITSQGKILPCENVNHIYSFGTVKNGSVNLDFDALSTSYNEIHDRIRKQLCDKCFRSNNYCSQCIYLLDLIPEKLTCFGFMSEKAFANYLSEMISFFENNTKHYKTIIDEITID